MLGMEDLLPNHGPRYPEEGREGSLLIGVYNCDTEEAKLELNGDKLWWHGPELSAQLGFIPAYWGRPS